MGLITKEHLKADLTKLLHEAYAAGLAGAAEPELAMFNTVVEVYVNEAEKIIREEIENGEPTTTDTK